MMSGFTMVQDVLVGDHKEHVSCDYAGQPDVGVSGCMFLLCGVDIQPLLQAFLLLDICTYIQPHNKMVFLLSSSPFCFT